MIDLHLIGIGTGNPDHLTRAAEAAMRAADLILLPRKRAEAAELFTVRQRLCEAVLGSVGWSNFGLEDTGPGNGEPRNAGPGGAGPGRAEAIRTPRIVAFDLPERDGHAPYLTAVGAWHDAIAAAWAEQIAAHLPHGGRLALLVWGDPSLYDSTLRIAERLRAGGMDLRVTVTAGITSLQALTAAHAIPLNDLAAPVTITTGRRLAEGGWPAGVDTVAVMLDGDCAFDTIDPAGVRIWWGAYLGMAQEALAAGMLADTGPVIRARRAALRAEHGWIMDIYLLRRERR